MSTKLKKYTSISMEEVAAKDGQRGDLLVLHSPRTGLATGHVPTAIDSAKRIAWVRTHA